MATCFIVAACACAVVIARVAAVKECFKVIRDSVLEAASASVCNGYPEAGVEHGECEFIGCFLEVNDRLLSIIRRHIEPTAEC